MTRRDLVCPALISRGSGHGAPRAAPEDSGHELRCERPLSEVSSAASLRIMSPSMCKAQVRLAWRSATKSSAEAGCNHRTTPSVLANVSEPDPSGARLASLPPEERRSQTRGGMGVAHARSGAFTSCGRSPSTSSDWAMVIRLMPYGRRFLPQQWRMGQAGGCSGDDRTC
jgi:hypothetical protein